MDKHHTFFMQEAIRLSKKGMEAGDGGPFGAVIVRNGRILGSGWNRVLRTNDPTAHAEIVAIRDACSRTGDYWLEGSTLYANCEPCPMCLAAIYWARIDQVIYAATREDAAAVDFDDERIYGEICRPMVERSLVMHQCLRNEAVQIMQSWPAFDMRKRY